MSIKLLRGGTVLVHSENDHITAKTNTDVLIKGNTIAEIANSIDAPADAMVIGCTDKLISPGFVDTHHHVWQTQLKGRHGNETLLEYMYTGNFNSSVFSAKDVFWGQLGGCLEMIHAGTTTVVDHAHMNYSTEHNTNAISATVASGIRSVFCYCPTPRVDSWNPLTFNNNMLEDFVVDTFERLADEAPFGDGRVTLGFAFDGWFLPKETILPLFDKVTKRGIRTITTHSVRNATMGGFSSLPELLDSYGILDERILLSHSTNMTPKEADLCLSKKL